MGGGPPSFPLDSSCLVVLRTPALFDSLRLRGYHPLRRRLSIRSSPRSSLNSAGPYPALHFCRAVWALPRSLATTCGIIFIFSSYGYLDVSVPHVRLPLRDDRPSTCRVAPFGNLRIKDYLHLPPAYRSLSRPSSPPRAKASTVCPCLLSYFRLPHG